MAVYDLEEQEQIDELKAWWNKWGNLITSIAVACAVASVGWQGWKWYQRQQSAEAAGLFAVVEKAAAAGDAAAAREATGKIVGEYGSTPYATLASLRSAKIQADAGETDNAALPLEWVMKHADLPAVRDIARLRLAAVRLNAGDAAAAESLLTDPVDETLMVRYNDLRGDALVAAGKPAEARAAYEAAIESLNASPVVGDRSIEIIRLKRDALAGGAQ